MTKFRVFNKKYSDNWGQELSDFLIDPRPNLYVGYGGGPSRHIEEKAQRLWEAHAKLVELLVSKGQITLAEALQTLDVDSSDLNGRYEIREVKDE